MRHYHWGFGVVVAVAWTLTACGDDPVLADVARCTEDTGTVSATVTVGTAVVFDWEPRCAVALLLVEQDGGDVWAINTDEGTWDDPPLANRIQPPVTYGVLPTGITDQYGPEQLLGGVTYDLVLWRVVANTTTAQCLARSGSGCLLTSQAFTR